VLAALAAPANEARVAEAILRETGTLGVRVSAVRRWELDRDWCTVQVAGRDVRVKVGRLDGRALHLAPEHDDCAAVAAETGQPASAVWSAALAAAREELEGR
jgi:uncharacterized protein (DUF111 family)